MNYLPIKYYTPEDISGTSALDFQDARKGYLLEVMPSDGTFLALIQKDNGETGLIDASMMKIVGDDIKRTVAKLIEEIKNMKHDYVPKSLHLQFDKDLDNLKNS